MRRRNRKKRMDGFASPVPVAGFLVLISSFALIYVWLGCRCDSLGKEIRKLEQERVVLHKKFLNEEYRWAQMKSPRSIEKALARFNIAMTWPANSQIIRLQDPEKKRHGPVRPGHDIAKATAADSRKSASEEWQIGP